MRRAPEILCWLSGAALVTIAHGDAGEQRPTVPHRLAELAPRVGEILDTDLRVERLEARIAASAGLEDRLALVYELGTELLRGGRTEEALDVFGQIRELFAQPGVDANPSLVRELDTSIALAWLRLGEQENCILLHGAGSCLLPIRPEAQHRRRRGSERALAELLALLERRDDPGLRWLAALAAMTLGRWPEAVPEPLRLPARLFEAGPEAAAVRRFEDRAPAVGLDTLGTSGGVVVEDLDGDGRLDVVVSAWTLDENLRYYRNRGDGRFEERTDAAGLEGQVGGLNLLHADVDGDGDADLLVLRGAWMGERGEQPNSLLRNDGGRFVDVTRESGLWSERPTQTAAFADIDLDGDLDLFVGNETTPGASYPCELFRNDGRGGFREIAAELGLDRCGPVKGVAWGDVDGDGDPDLYLSRLGRENLLWRNDLDAEGRLRFTDVTAEAGVAGPLMSFPTWFFDIDNDGDLDLFVASYSGFTDASLALVVRDLLGEPVAAPRPRLYRNRGDGRFDDVTAAWGLETVLLAMGSNWGDLDGDGWPDMYIGTGEPALSTLVPNRMFRNEGGRRFVDVTLATGVGHLQKGHGVAFADVDDDGDQDLMHVVGGAWPGDVYQNALFENPGYGNRWLRLELRGTRANRSAVGARVEVIVRDAAGRRSIHHLVGTGGSFGSDPLRAELGLGAATAVEQVRVRWPRRGDQLEVYRGLRPDSAWRLTEGRRRPEPLGAAPIRLATAPPAHRHPPPPPEP